MATTKTKYRRTSRGTQKETSNLASRVALVENEMIRKDFPKFAAGDTLRVHVRIKEGEKERIQAFEGFVIAKGNRGASKSFTVRKVSHGIGVERIFLETSPKIAKIEVVQMGRVRRAKLYYLRNLEGKAARVERDVEAVVAPTAAPAAAKTPAGSKT